MASPPTRAQSQGVGLGWVRMPNPLAISRTPSTRITAIVLVVVLDADQLRHFGRSGNLGEARVRG